VRALATIDPAVRAGRIELEKTYTNDFARRAKDKFKA
jgi:NitT/TauT family transport system substrate-binding protein